MPKIIKQKNSQPTPERNNTSRKKMIRKTHLIHKIMLLAIKN